MINTDRYSQYFISPEQFDKTKKKPLFGPNGWILFVACNSGIQLAQDVKNEYQRMLKENNSELKEVPLLGTNQNPLTSIFEDSETCPRLSCHVAGSNAYVFQCVHENISGNTVNENIQQLLQVIRTLRAHRAQTITVVTPYAPYSRQDKPTFMQREATHFRLFVDQLKISGADNHLTYHPHALSLYGLYEPDMKVVALSGLDLFIDVFSFLKNQQDTVVVSTDSGGAKFTIHYAEAMNLSHAIGNKFRSKKDETQMIGIIGDMENKEKAIITDDETVTGSSFLNVVKALHHKYGIKEIYAAITHMKIRKHHINKLIEAHQQHGLVQLHVTDSIPPLEEIKQLDFVSIHSLAQRFASTINRLHYNQSVSEVFYDLKTK